MAFLNLGSLNYLTAGEHALTLEVTDGKSTNSDSMTLIIKNTPPTVKAMAIFGALVAGVNPIILQGEVSDFDGDTLEYEWRKDGDILDQGTVKTPKGGGQVPLRNLVVSSADPRFPVGRHEVELRVSDGSNPPVSTNIVVEVVRIGPPDQI